MLWSHGRNEVESRPTANNLQKNGTFAMKKLHIRPKTIT